MDDDEWYADPVVRLAAELMDPLHGVPIAPGPSAAELIAIARRPTTMGKKDKYVKPADRMRPTTPGKGCGACVNGWVATTDHKGKPAWRRCTACNK